jgi:hypothetical protein
VSERDEDLRKNKIKTPSAQRAAAEEAEAAAAAAVAEWETRRQRLRQHGMKQSRQGVTARHEAVTAGCDSTA